MIPVVAIIKAKAHQEKNLEAVLKKMVVETKKEPGCMAYTLHLDTKDSRVFVFIEQWMSEQALQAHLTSTHIQAALARQEELIESLDIRALMPL